MREANLLERFSSRAHLSKEGRPGLQTERITGKGNCMMKTSPIRDLGAFSQVDPRCALRVCFGRQRKLWIETLLIVIVAILRNGYYRFYKRNYPNSNNRLPNCIFQNELIPTPHLSTIRLDFVPIVEYLSK